MRSVKMVFGIVGALVPIAYCGGLVWYFIRGNTLEGPVGQGLGPVHQAMVRMLQAGDDHFEQRGALADAIGARPDRERMQAACDLARALVAGALDNSPPARQRRLIAAHGEIARLASQVATYNYDPALLVMEIGGLLASAALPRETA